MNLETEFVLCAERTH